MQSFYFRSHDPDHMINAELYKQVKKLIILKAFEIFLIHTSNIVWSFNKINLGINETLIQ